MTIPAAGQARLLGRPAVLHDGRWLSLPRGKSSALLYYLAYQDGWVGRDDLVFLLWSDSDERKARGNLRPLLSRLRRLPYAAGLEVEATRLRWDVPTDVRTFRDALREGRPAQAVRDSRGPLLEGFYLRAAPEFDSWLELERAELQRVWREAVVELSARFGAEGRHAQAADLLGRLSKSDPLDEVVVRLLLAALARAGRASEALRAFEAFSATLAREVDGAPAPATRHLVERIAAGEVPAAAADGEAAARRPRRGAPAPATRFVGREREVARVMRQLRDPACRLVTLVAPGGMGKTCLAIEVADRLAPDYRDGVRFVPFSAVTSAESMLGAIADALPFSFFGGRDPKTQLLEHLESKDMLLVLDNLEHLLAGVGLVGELLEKAPDLTALATSRERLGLHAEWVYDLAGMGLPAADGDPDDLGNADAVELFVQSARMARAEFALAGNEEAVARVCRLVGGLPLAIELAASWLRVLGPDEVAAELGEGLDLLETSLRDLPERHHDIRAVFETSWRRLSRAEQAALQRLSAFHGGFTREAAVDVAEVSLPLLLALVNKTFVRREGSERFTQHPLMWRYLREKAVADADTTVRVGARHAAYYTAFVAERTPLLQGRSFRGVIESLDLELANIRAAWFWAAERGREDLLNRAAEGLVALYFDKRQWVEGQTALAHAAERLERRSVVRGRLLRGLGRFKHFQNDYPGGTVLLRESAAIFEEHGAVRDEALALHALALNYSFSPGASHRSAAVWQRCVALFREVGDRYHLARALGNYAHYFRDPAERERRFRESVALFREVEGNYGLTLSLHNLAICLSYSRGAYREALEHLGEAVTVERSRGVAFRLALWLNWQGRVLGHQGRYDEAQARHREARAIAEGVGPGVGASEFGHALYGLGRLALARGELDEAAGLLGEAVEQTRRHPDPFSLRAEILDALAGVALEQGRLDDAAEMGRDSLGHLDSQGHATYEPVWIYALCHHRLGEIDLAGGDTTGAWEHLSRGLDFTREWGLVPATLHLALGFAALLERRGDTGGAARLLHVVTVHPAGTFETRVAAGARLEALSGDLGLGRGAPVDLDAAIEEARSASR